ncbi:MAG: hypothetical protein D3907_03200 [Candidatus Electrothrix sp. AUS3]|nr:hypothetical protein [Candidatus Electrothrix gigas]
MNYFSPIENWFNFCVLLIALFLLKGVVYLSIMPPFEGWDEYQHLAYISYLDKYHERPILNNAFVSRDVLKQIVQFPVSQSMLDQTRSVGTEEASFSLAKLSPADRQLHRKTHQTIQRVTESIETNFHFNTAIAGVMELVNQITVATGDGAKQPVEDAVLREALQTVVMLLFPMVPHFCQELWQVTGHEKPLDHQQWPEYDTEAIKEDELTIVVQVNGKVRSRLQVATGTDTEEIKQQALDDERIIKFISDKTVKKIIVVKGKLVNIVV